MNRFEEAERQDASELGDSLEPRGTEWFLVPAGLLILSSPALHWGLSPASELFNDIERLWGVAGLIVLMVGMLTQVSMALMRASVKAFVKQDSHAPILGCFGILATLCFATLFGQIGSEIVGWGPVALAAIAGVFYGKVIRRLRVLLGLPSEPVLPKVRQTFRDRLRERQDRL